MNTTLQNQTMHSPPKALLQTIINGHHDSAVIEALRLSCAHSRLQDPDWMWPYVEQFFWVARAVKDKEVCVSVFKALQDAGMPMGVQGRNGKTAAHGASAGAIRALAEMAEDARAVVNTHDHNGMSPLTWSCSIDANWPSTVSEQSLNVQAIEALLDAGAYRDSKCSQMGKTPLLHLCSNSRIYPEVQKQLLHLLIDRGADPHAKDFKAQGVFSHLIDSMSEPSIALDLIDQGFVATGPQLLEVAKVCVIKSDPVSLERFLRLGLKPHKYMPLLGYACRYGATSCCAKLLEYGCEPTQRDVDQAHQGMNGQGCVALIQAWQAKKQAMEAFDEFPHQKAPARQSAQRQAL